MDGLIFDIQRFSVHDGPGIRTTVFMKGCPMRCPWCHNPEGLAARPEIQFFKEKCILCGRCAGERTPSMAEGCPSQALRVVGRTVSEEEVVSEILKDRVFYAADGGVTFSGGECLLQADFVASVLRRAKQEGLSTAVDTSGCVEWQKIEKTMDVCDLYLYDIKCISADTHKKFTGRDNALILENLLRLARRHKCIWIRIPVIPDFNDNLAEMEKIAAFLASVPNIKSVTLMPYHTLGASKYETLGISDYFQTEKRISDAFIREAAAVFERHRLPILT